jgi:calcium-dependent protein kinase
VGKGMFGSVFKTFSAFKPDHFVAIKVIDKRTIQDDLKLIEEEVACLHQLDHPNIVKYYETYNDTNYIYLVMELVNGGTLDNYMELNGLFDEHKAIGFMRNLFSAINHIHARNIVHRDIKPENIMINKGDEVRLIDFGMSKSTAKTKEAMMVGTPLFMAPEVFDGKYSKKVDTWSLGVTLYMLISGQVPFTGNSMDELKKNI